MLGVVGQGGRGLEVLTPASLLTFRVVSLGKLA